MSAPPDDVVLEYLAECREHLADIENDLLRIEQGGSEIDEELVNKVFRAAHSIKGGASFFDLNRIRDLAHRVESVLDLIRSRQLTPTPEIVNVLLLSFDKLRDLIENVATSEEQDVSEFIRMLEELAFARMPETQKSDAKRKVSVATSARTTRLSFTSFDFDTARRAGRWLYLLEYDLIHDVQRKNQSPLDLVKRLMQYGVVVDTVLDVDSAGSLDDSPTNRLSLDILYATVLGPDLIAEAAALPRERMWKADRTGACSPLPPDEPQEQPVAAPQADAAPTAAQPSPGANEPDAAVERRLGPADRRGAEPAAEAPAVEATVRLNVGLLDVLMNLAGELVLGRNQLNDAVARRDPAMIQAAGQRINVITSDVQDAVMRTRMQPVGNLFQKFPRLVRDIARKLGKDVRLAQEGGDVELDKTIIEGLSDPLTHMVRNSIDHGIETADIRRSHGKPAEGTVYLRARNEAGMVVIEVADDGRGLDPEKIAAAAVSKGLIAPQAVSGMSAKEKLSLVFLPGLSTASKVSELSGRGVGLDVVKTNLDRLGGSVEIQSRAGEGACFRIRLPLTLAIIPSLLVSANSERLAIPLGNVQELVRVAAADIERRIGRAGSARVLMLRDGILPLIRLDETLDLGSAAQTGPVAALNIVVVSSGPLQYGVVVERLHGTVEIVVKPLGRHLRQLREYAGATVLGDGCVALIIDVGGLAARAGLNARDMQTAAAALSDDAVAAETHQLLVFRNSPVETCAVPLHAAARVLKIKPGDVEHVGGRRTMQHRGGSLPLVMLSDLARVQETPLDGDSIVVVIEAAGRSYGLIGSMPVDVVESSVDVDPETLRQPGVMGSTILRGRTTLLLDTSELGRSAWPGLEAGTGQAGSLADATVLIAEDSAFFRDSVTRILEGAGAAVLAAGDGQAAWEIFERRAPDLSLVITDVEMPRLDGLELTRRIRSAPRSAALPVIMLTSLDADEHRRRGCAAGASAYCIKLDQDQLLQTASELLASAKDRGGSASAPSDMERLAQHLRTGSRAAATPAAEFAIHRREVK